MAALFEMPIRVGGDPRSFGPFTALREELAKLGHPACPDVDWARVEQSCLALFEHNGGDLQTACCYTLARGQRHGLEGISQGVAVIEALSREWPRLWPPMASRRLDLLGWLFDQLQLLLRSLAMSMHNVPALVQLDTELARLQARLLPHRSTPLLTLQALRHQIACLVERLEQNYTSTDGALAPIQRVAPVMIVPPPEVAPRRRRLVPWLFAGALMAALLAGFGWRTWLASTDHQPPLPEPVRLDSLSLFDAGSATLKPGSTKVLVNALVGIKAQPGWLILISGHTDTTGDAQHNLQLSYARATAVRDWMQHMGDLADNCFAVQGAAGAQPIASNDTVAGRAANRRVDIQLVPQLQACAPTSPATSTAPPPADTFPPLEASAAPG